MVLFADEFCSEAELYPLHADKSFAQVSLSRCMRKVVSDLECLLRRKPLLSLNVRCIYRLA